MAKTKMSAPLIKSSGKKITKARLERAKRLIEKSKQETKENRRIPRAVLDIEFNI